MTPRTTRFRRKKKREIGTDDLAESKTSFQDDASLATKMGIVISVAIELR